MHPTVGAPHTDTHRSALVNGTVEGLKAEQMLLYTMGTTSPASLREIRGLRCYLILVVWMSKRNWPAGLPYLDPGLTQGEALAERGD